MESTNVKIVVGLGNPGRQYERTRHNVGFMVLAELSKRWQLASPRKAFGGEVCETRMGDQKVLLLAPLTFMNLSGSAVLEIVTFYKVSPVDVLIVLDDMALAVGQLRARTGGSSGGQKGLGDIINRLGTSEIPRLRIGIGSPGVSAAGRDYVLTPFAPGERDRIEQAVFQAAVAVEDWVSHGMLYVMERHNRKAESEND